MRIVILGAGKMGSWFARELFGEHDIATYDIDKEKLRNLKDIKILSEIYEVRVFNPEFLINAVSLHNTIAAFEKVKPYILESCIISDIASIKSGLEDYYRTSPFRFVSIHPMFGPTFADMKSLKEESVIIVKGSDIKGVQLFRSFFERFKVKIFEYSFEKHDRMMAYSLTIPFISSMAFAACVDKTAVPGTTFARHMKLAKGLLSEDDHLLAEILFNLYSMAELDKITAKLEYLKHIIKDRDYEELESFLQRLKENII
jgi:prephenate dehydrogenase